MLNTRSVTTLTGGMLIPWIMGVDGGGTADGYLTAAASKFQNDPPTIKALPDDGRFPADNRHPDVVLHFSNDADPTSQQTRFVKGAGEFSFATPAAQYEKPFLILTSGEGTSALTVTLTYADASTDIVNQALPDYYLPIPPQIRCFSTWLSILQSGTSKTRSPRRLTTTSTAWRFTRRLARS